MWRNKLYKGVVVLFLLLFCLLALFVGTFPLTKLTPWWGRMGYFDWPIFIEAATQFIQHGILYYPDLERYAPNAAIYKFPPLFASVLVVLLRIGFEAETLRIGIGTLQLLMYFVSIWICLQIVKARHSFFLYVSVFLFVATFEPFINNYIGLQLEAFILFLLCLMLWCLARQKQLTAGILLGLAIALKLYPLFMVCIIACTDKRIRFLTGITVGVIASLVFTTLVIGIDQNYLYFSRIAPALATEMLDTNLRNVSINNLVFQAGLLTSQAHYIGMALMAGVVAFIFWSVRNKSHLLAVTASCSLLVAALVLGTKNSWGNYQLLLVLPMIILLAEATKQKALDYVSIPGLLLAASLLFFSPPHRLYFLSDLLFGLKEIPVVKLFVFMRAIAGMVVLVLCLRFLVKTAFMSSVNRIHN